MQGNQIATNTIKQQSKYFIDAGINEKFLLNGSINVDISPYNWEIIKPDFNLKNILWRKDFYEDFSFIKLKLRFENKIYAGLLYNPKRTKNPKTTMEILSEYIEKVKYGKDLELLIPDEKIILF